MHVDETEKRTDVDKIRLKKMSGDLPARSFDY